jgi:hypothetical protein
MLANYDRLEGWLRGEVTAGFNPREAFFQGQGLRKSFPTHLTLSEEHAVIYVYLVPCHDGDVSDR